MHFAQQITFFLSLLFHNVLSADESVPTIIRFRSNLVLYDGYGVTNKKVLYTNSDKALWKNLPDLAKDAGLEMKALICGIGAGAWIAYPSTDFKTDNASRSTWAILGETCIAADDINSVQAVGPINKEFEGLVAYTEVNFGSDYKLVSNDTSASESGIKSLISPGGEPAKWTLEGDGKKICLIRPASHYALGICVIPDIPTQMGIQAASIKIGCDEDAETLKADTSTFQFELCFGMEGAFKILDNYMPVPVLTAICSGGGSPDQQLGFSKILDTWKFRMNPDRQAEINPADIDKDRRDEMNPTRMRMLNYFFSIFHDSCPQVPEEYFNLVRYIFMQHLKRVWSKVPDIIWDRNDTKNNWRKAEEYMINCYEERKKSAPLDPSQLGDMRCVRRIPGLDRNLPAELAVALDLFLEGDNLDHIVEQVWLMLNYVGPYCAGVMNYHDNFWVDFINLFRRQFLLPLLQQWINPGTWQVYYTHMFQGYDIDKGKRLIIACVEELISNTPSMDPIDRPSSSAKEFLSVSRKRLGIKSENPKENGKATTGAGMPEKKPKKRDTSSAGGDKSKKGVRRTKSKKQHEHDNAITLKRNQDSNGTHRVTGRRPRKTSIYETEKH